MQNRNEKGIPLFLCLSCFWGGSNRNQNETSGELNQLEDAVGLQDLGYL